MPSKALEGLTDRLRDVDQLMAAHRAAGGDKRGRRFELEGVNRAAVLMLSAHFEGYLEDVMQEAVAAVNAQLGANRVTAGFSNPQPKKIDELFEFLGMSKVSHSISWQRASNDSVRKNLNKLVETRNRIAHGGLGVKVYKTEITSLRKYVEGFAKRLDKKVRAQVHTLTGSHPWTP